MNTALLSARGASLPLSNGIAPTSSGTSSLNVTLVSRDDLYTSNGSSTRVTSIALVAATVTWPSRTLSTSWSVCDIIIGKWCKTMVKCRWLVVATIPGGLKGITMSLPTPMTFHMSVVGVNPLTCDESTPTVVGATAAMSSSVNPSSLSSVLNCDKDMLMETMETITEASWWMAEESLGCAMLDNCWVASTATDLHMKCTMWPK